MRKQSSKSVKFMEYIMNHPNAKVGTVAKKFGITPSLGYQLRKKALDNQIGVFAPPEMVPMPDPVNVARNFSFKGTADSVGTTAVLQERGQRYGLFSEQARIAQSLKNALRAEKGFYRLSEVQKEALEMVMHKIARMLNGDPTYDDNVVDIMGYTELMLRHMRGKEHEL